MPIFDTPKPILATVELGVGDVRIAATDRTDTTVDVRPTDPGNTSDVAAAARTRVEFSAGRLLIKAPKSWRHYTPRGGGDSVDVQIELPAGSQVHGETGVAALHTSGPLGECHYATGVGDLHIDQAGHVHLRTGVGDIAVDRVSGHAQVSTGSGAVRIGSVDGTAVIKGANGDTWVGDISGDLRVVTANGSIDVEHAHASVIAKTANGDVRFGAIEAGTVVAQTSLGKVEIGIGAGVAAWLDVNTSFGKVSNQLDATTAPEPGNKTVEVRARSTFGDITIRRSSPSTTVAAAL